MAAQDLAVHAAAIRHAMLMTLNNREAPLLDQDDPAGPRRPFIKALEMDPGFDFVVHLDGWRQQQRSGDSAGARAALQCAEAMCRCAIDINPRHAAMPLTLSHVLEESGDLLGAVHAVIQSAGRGNLDTPGAPSLEALVGRLLWQGAKHCAAASHCSMDAFVTGRAMADRLLTGALGNRMDAAHRAACLHALALSTALAVFA